MKGLWGYGQDADFMNSGKNMLEISARAVTEVGQSFLIQRVSFSKEAKVGWNQETGDLEK